MPGLSVCGLKNTSSNNFYYFNEVGAEKPMISFKVMVHFNWHPEEQHMLESEEGT